MPFRQLALRASRRSRDPRNKQGRTLGCLYLGSRDRLAPAVGRHLPEGPTQPFSAISASLLAPREIVFSARCGAGTPLL